MAVSLPLTDSRRQLFEVAKALLVRHFGLKVVSIRHPELNKEWFDRVRYFDRLLGFIEDVPGTIVECGVASGGSLSALASLARSRGTMRHVWGFDTWAGLPEPSGEDLAPTSIAVGGLFSDASLEMVVANLRFHGFSAEDIRRHFTFRQGLFSATLHTYSGEPIALLHVDADIYQSYRDVLTALWPKVVVGGIAAFDEYHEPVRWPGARRAVDEFLASLPPGSALLEHDQSYGQYYAIKVAHAG